MFRPVHIVFGLMLVASSHGRAQQVGDPQAGLELARKVCAACHAISVDQARSPDGRAPRFERIAQTPGMTPMALTVALQTWHRSMPNIMLERKETDDMIAYIMSLRK